MAANDPVPDVSATTDSGETVRLSELASGGPLVVFFYPKAFTSGCTAQTCHFRDLTGEFADLGASVVGVSRDQVDTQAKFSSQHGLSFPLLADGNGEVARALGAKRPGPLPSRRQTVVLDSDLRVLGTFRSETDMDSHADKALELLRDRAT